MDYLELTKQILVTNLQLGDVDLDVDTPIMGAMPQFNSLSIVNLITAIEEETGCAVDDDEITAELFESVGSLAAFIESKA